jgi:2-(1,2-epoxy-1,2-dihydrophenyl)acetyl-CoA isomerase
MRTDFDGATLTAHGPVAVLALNRPASLNAISEPLAHALERALDAALEPQSGFRALVLSGDGRAFCSGADLNEAQPGMDAGARLDDLYHPLLRRLRDSRVPIVTAVNGPAVGIGMSLALMGDLVVAARSAFFVQAFAGIGLVPDGGSTWLLPRLIGLARARELALLAERLSAEKACEWGLINRVVDDEVLLDQALILATKLAEGPASLVLTRRLFWESPQRGYEEQLILEREAQARAGRSEDFTEGLQAFRQKRPAKFKGL